MKNELTRVQMNVLKQIRPSRTERERLHRVTQQVIAAAQTALARRKLSASVAVIGSAARDTWISGDQDIDIFIGFDTSVSREDLERYGLEIGKEIALEGYSIGFAEHPYVKARCGGFDIDVVPHYRIKNTREIFSAVDRTPFHQQFVAEHLSGRQDDVRLLKQFLKGAGIYGAELRTKGFSGYLCELLVIKFGSFITVLNNVQDWKAGTCISFTSAHARNHFASPLAVIDPVDTNRNVAAAVSLDSLSTFIDAARSFLESPCSECFFPQKIPPLDAGSFRAIVKKRKTTLFGVTFDLPDLVDDIAYPQLERAYKGMQVALLRNGFCALRGDIYYHKGQAVLLFEMLVSHLPCVGRHEGPPVDSKRHANKFKKKYLNNPNVLSGPYIDKGRYVVELQRKYLTVPEFLETEFQNVRSSKAVVKAMEAGFRILKDEELLESDSLRLFLAHYFDRTLNNCD
ncbi:MAG TPA: CCA tRNA nucleotidyltransferase [Candidatus Bathyarchaeia archaeon]|nr:CCA tRNA nucleotidyltransferase [Candidatus Bathyarchaeia archaeon]